MFGSQYEDIIKRFPDDDIPPSLLNMINIIEEHGAKEKGIFRVPGLTCDINELKRKIERSEAYGVEEFAVDCIASTFKAYLRELPEPLFTFDISVKLFRNNSYDDIVEGLIHIKKNFKKRFIFLWRTFELLSNISKNSEENLMDDRNLSIVFGPTLLRHEDEELLVQTVGIYQETMKTILSKLKNISNKLENI